jgi:Lon protease-like protein
MFNPSDLPETIPLFPLPGALLLPRSRLPLNIFEPRYLAMLDDALKTQHRLIGMIQPMEGEGGRLHAIGCAGRVVGFNETDDGRYMITLGGISRFRLRESQAGFTPYIRAQVSWDGFARDTGKTESDPSFNRATFLNLLGRYFRAHGISSDWDSLEKAENELLINSLSMLSPFGVEDKQALLEAPTLADRRETLVTLLEFSLASGDTGGKLQ